LGGLNSRPTCYLRIVEMSTDYNQHYVCTLDEARRIIAAHDQFSVSNCGCREAKGVCGRSRMDVCLYFNPDFPPTGHLYPRKEGRE